MLLPSLSCRSSTEDRQLETTSLRQPAVCFRRAARSCCGVQTLKACIPHKGVLDHCEVLQGAPSEPATMADKTDIISLVQLAVLEIQAGGFPSTPVLTLLLSKV